MSKKEEFLARLKAASANVKTEEPMKRHTTFQVGGAADYFVTPENSRELKAVLALCREEAIPFFILGNGSNLLVSDSGYRGVIVHIGRPMAELSIEGTTITAGAGVTLARLAQAAMEAELTGLEFASGIPGTLGGALVMNAGAYGGEMAQVVKNASILTKTGEERRLSLTELQFGYRTSAILREGYLALGAELNLQPGDKAEIKKTMEELAAKRREKQPLEYPSAGSTFKRPEGYFAGKLIMDAGLSGFAVGGACVSEKHCGFVVNRGSATAADIWELCRLVKEIVKEKFGVTLELEVRLLGDFG